MLIFISEPGWNRDVNYCPLHSARGYFILGGIIMEEIKEMKEKTRAIAHFMEKEQNKTNKELLIAAAICTFIGILIGFFIGKTTTSKNTIKKYNECFSYDFGDDEEEKDEE